METDTNLKNIILSIINAGIDAVKPSKLMRDKINYSGGVFSIADESYDLNNYDTVIIQLNNYRKFLIRNELITKERKERINIFLNALEKLIYFKEGDPKVNVSDLNQYICNLKNINYRNWYMLKLRELNILK